MRLPIILTLVSLMLLLMGAASCVSRPAGSPGVSASLAASPPSATQPVESSWMFDEASLPEGFPPPGPIGQVIVKQYPAYRAARTLAPADTTDASRAMFRPLFNHIKRQRIAMTAPVEMTYSPEAERRTDQPVAMAFMYGDPKSGTPGEDGKVQVVDLSAQTVLSVAVRGGYEKSFETGMAQLRQWLSENPGRYEITGPPRFLGYNSPFVPSFWRLGEVQLPVRSQGAAERQ
jgi:hypothetical protein